MALQIVRYLLREPIGGGSCFTMVQRSESISIVVVQFFLELKGNLYINVDDHG